MFRLKHRPYNLFLVFAVLMILISITVGGDDVDMHLHDTYFVVKHSFIPLGGMFVVFWSVYYLFRHMLPSKVLTIINVWGTLLPVFLINLLPTTAFFAVPETYSFTGGNLSGYTIWFYMLLLAFCIGQICLVINLLKGIITALSRKFT